jgi:CelD/BcsL family acetyltransferase involved in cellulose biosynthesis
VKLNIVDPLLDRRWDDLVASHPQASAFHQRFWLEALARTYGYEPLVLTSAAPGEPLRDGLVLCRVASWLTGKRLVSLPFSDHCDPLLSDPAQLPDFLSCLRSEAADHPDVRYVELRPRAWEQDENSGFQTSSSYWLHELDLRPDLQEIFDRFHKNSIQRKIGRAEKAGLSYEKGHAQALVAEFYRLLLMTRRRHQVLPQPRAWFKNLVEGGSGRVQIRIARKDGIAIAAMLTLQHGSSVVYKYGCSDGRAHNLGGMPFLFWRLVEESKAAGANEIDFGRSDLDQKGLITFKDRLGATRRLLKYCRHQRKGRGGASVTEKFRAVRQLLGVLPDGVFAAAGGALYRHMG